MRYLITTADERSWKHDRPVLFLGEWCRRHGRRDVWSKMDAVVAKPYGLGPGERARDVQRCDTVTNELLAEVARALNAYHGTAYTSRYWRILLGRWLQRFVTVAFNRYHVLGAALAANAVSGTTLLVPEDYSLATSDSLAFIWATNDDLWNHVLFVRALAQCGESVPMHRVAVPDSGMFMQRDGQSTGARRGARELVRQTLERAARALARDTDALVVRSYLPLSEELKLQAALGQVPQLYRTPLPPQSRADVQARERLALDIGARTGFDAFVRALFAEVIPTCFVEGYSRLVGMADALPWPRRPKFIFTSNSFDSDEVFKVWTAAQTERGTQYFVGQHGNNYGTMLGNGSWTERVTPDRFITWGWRDSNPNCAPAFIFKTVGERPKQYDRNGGLLLIELCLPHWLGPSDEYYEYGVYQEEQFRFVEALPFSVRDALTVRLHGGFRGMPWPDDKCWSERISRVRLETGATPIRDLIGRSRVVMHSYDSTGVLETLRLNIPTMAFWQGGLDHLEPHAKPYYEMLQRVGIVLDTAEAAADAVARRWSDLEAWWNGDAVQSARLAFCEQYARAVPDPIATLKRIFNA